MLRSATEAALNDLHVRLVETADQYSLLSEKPQTTDAGVLFEELAGARRRAAEKTEFYIRRLGGMPDVPDKDWETLEQLFAEAKQALTPDSGALIGRALEHETQLSRSVDDLLGQPVDADTRGFLEELRGAILDARERLQRAGAQHGSE
jgi:hypothetical protein